VSVGEKRAKAAKKLKQLKKKDPGIQPILLEDRAIARTWWGKSWNLNLEGYADYSNRIGRGRSYVRHGAVLDLRIRAGLVESLVQGSRAKPYSVVINIRGIKKNIWKDMKKACAGKLDSLPELLTGKFPKALGDIFTARGRGLFPSPKEIEFDCSCPDWAYMCKHVAATLYGIGARLDDDPSLFFKLRRVNMDDLVDQVIKDRSDSLLKKAKKKSERVIADSDLAGMFGIVMEETTAFNVREAAPKAPRSDKPSRARAKRAKTETVKGKPSPDVAPVKPPRTKSPAGAKTQKLTETEQILRIIRRSRKGVNVPALKQKTGFDEKKIRNVIFKSFREGIIERAGRGIYRGVKKSD
jgi:uncharacterized Zn finger protein